jgi:hypothetical protein
MSRAPGQKRWNECERKIRFRDEHEAIKQARKHGLRAYECTVCSGWHLTSKALRDFRSAS